MLGCLVGGEHLASENERAEPLGEAFSYSQFQKRMTATEIYKILKHSNLKGFKY